MNLVSSQSYYSVVTSHRVTLGYPGGDKYSHTSVLVRFRTCQILYLSQFDGKKMFQHSALARNSSHLLERV